jgi:hypothetical protein
MRRRTCLERLNRSFTRRIRQLEVVANQIAGKNGHDIDRALSFVTIEALSAWSGFAREFYLSCAFLGPRTIGGQHVSHHNAAIVDERLALLHSIFVLKGKTLTTPRIAARDEPAWHEKRVLSSLSTSLVLSNDHSVILGLSYPTNFFDDLPTMRNFYAHRSQGTAEKVFRLALKRYSAATLRHPNDLLNIVFAGRVQTLIQEWLVDMRQIGLTICQ